MGVCIRLKRGGSKNRPHWRVVAADSRSPRDGRFLEILGSYDPKTDPATIELKADKIKKWLAVGAKPSPTVKSLMKKKGI